MTKKIQIIAFFFFAILNIQTATAQGTSFHSLPDYSMLDGGVESPNTIFKTINKSDILKITLQTDLDYLIANKKKDDYQKATLTVDTEKGAEVHEVKVKPRGKFRRKTCDFPPLKIKFNKAGLKEKGIHTSHKSLKLVTHCMDNDPDAEQRIVKEYMAYKMYNLLTEASFKVQLVEITYVNDTDASMNTQYGFIIENTNEMAERIDGTEVEGKFNLTLDSIQKNYQHLIPMFQYMIANMDWRTRMNQNIKTIDKKDGNRIMVPYDFDFSGLVDAPYAIPNKDYQQQNIQDRIYMNKVDQLKELKSTIKYFQVHKQDIINSIKQCEHLTKKNRRKMINYINDFYNTLDNPQLSKAAFVKA